MTMGRLPLLSRGRPHAQRDGCRAAPLFRGPVDAVVGPMQRRR